MLISVVIPTLGGKILFKTLESINNSSVKPAEIILCIPNDHLADSEKFKINNNIEILNTKTKGQVAQRAEGFLKARYDYVLQLDDDIILDKYCIEELVNCISKENKRSVGPKIFGLDNKYHSPRVKSKKNSFYEKFIFYLLNGKEGYIKGKISLSGIAFGVPNSDSDLEVDWLPGACILHNNNNLVNYNFYPYKGKAYSEDILHSKILKQNKISLIRSGTAKCIIDLKSGTSFSNVLYEFFNVLRIGFHIVDGKKNIYRYFLFQIITYTVMMKKIFIKQK